MSKLTILILFSLLFVGILRSQMVSMGTGLGSDILFFEKETSVGLNLNLSLEVPVSRIFVIDIKPGIAWNSEDFNGYELITYLKYFPFQSGINFILGVKLHANIGESGTSHYVRADLFVLPLIGIGYKIKVQKTFVTFDITYQKPFPNGVHYYHSYFENKDYYSTNFDAVISFYIGFAWLL